MIIKANQPGLLAAAQQALSGPAAEYTEHARGHGRTEERTVRAAAVTAAAPTTFPHAAQVFRVIRYVGGLDGRRRSKEVAYCITSLTPAKVSVETSPNCCASAGAPSRTKPTWVRDTTFNGDASTLSTGTAPQAMAIIRTPLITEPVKTVKS